MQRNKGVDQFVLSYIDQLSLIDRWPGFVQVAAGAGLSSKIPKEKAHSRNRI
jgi:hypothetical protein